METQERKNLIKGYKQFLPSKRRNHKFLKHLATHLQHYFTFEEIFIKFHLYDEKMIERFKNKQFFLEEFKRDQTFCSIFHPKHNKGVFEKKTKEHYSSIFKQFRKYFDYIQDQLDRIFGANKREKTFFKLFARNENSLKVWSMIQHFFDKTNPLADIYDFFVKQDNVLTISTSELNQMCEHLTKEYEKLSFCQYKGLFGDLAIRQIPFILLSRSSMKEPNFKKPLNKQTLARELFLDIR